VSLLAPPGQTTGNSAGDSLETSRVCFRLAASLCRSLQAGSKRQPASARRGQGCLDVVGDLDGQHRGPLPLTVAEALGALALKLAGAGAATSGAHAGAAGLALADEAGTRRGLSGVAAAAVAPPATEQGAGTTLRLISERRGQARGFGWPTQAGAGFRRRAEPGSSGEGRSIQTPRAVPCVGTPGCSAASGDRVRVQLRRLAGEVCFVGSLRPRESRVVGQES